MSNKNFLNKNSQYVQSLVDFILDTKPYHSKLTEIVEEYRFFENMSVKINEQTLIKTNINPTWSYNYFSGANPLFRTMPAQRVVSPSFRRESYIVGTDENKDMALVPYSYSKRAFDGAGANAVYVRRASGHVEPLTESVDYFQGHGSFQFQIKQTTNGNGDLAPLWSETRDDGVLATAIAETQDNALDLTNPNSSISKIRADLDNVQTQTTLAGGDAAVQKELDALNAIIGGAQPTLPRSYEALLAYLAKNTKILVDLVGLKRGFERYTSPLFFNMFTDMGVRQSGLPGQKIAITAGAPLETWNIIKVNPIAHDRPLFSSTAYGYITDLAGIVGQATILDQTLPTTDIVLTARADGKIFDLSSTNDPSHTGVAQLGVLYNDGRIAFTIQAGDKFGYNNGDTFYISVENLPARAEELDLGYGYDLDPYSDDAEVTPAFFGYDGRFTDFDLKTLGVAVTQAAVDGRRWRVRADIPSNAVPFAEISDGTGSSDRTAAGWAADNGAYTSLDEAIQIHLATLGGSSAFFVDTSTPSTFTPTNANCKSGPGLPICGDGYQSVIYRRVSQPNYAPVTYTVFHYNNTDSVPAPAGVSLDLYYTTKFAIEWSDDDFNTPANVVASIDVGQTFNSVEHGFSFTLTPASRPYVAAKSAEAIPPGTFVIGGDVFSFVIRNPLPTIREVPVGLNSTKVPRLIMHSDGFYDASAAKWTLTFKSPTQYVITSELADGFATPVQGTPLTVNIPTAGLEVREGLSFKGLGLHFTIVPANGLREGDKFIFHTFERKPSFLVHGSVSGFMGDVAYGETFNNGLITFTIEKPTAQTYVNNIAKTIGGFTYKLREDCPSVTYIFTPSSAGYEVTRSDIGVTGVVDNSATTPVFEDQYLNASLVGVTGPFKLDVNATELAFWNAPDVVILRPLVGARLPRLADKVIVEKTTNGTIGIALTPNQTNVGALSPITIDQRFINTDTRQSIPLSNTSPETSLLQGWLPLLVDKFDSTTSIAEFSDPTTLYKVRSAGSNEAVGQLRQLDVTNANEPIIFEWDSAFFQKYLPLNAEANVVTTGTGWNEHVHVKVSESVKFLIDGGPLTEDWLFHDTIHVQIGETLFLNMKSNYSNSFAVKIEDGPFAKFMPGYANMPYEGELSGDGSYDLGVPLTGDFHEAQELAAITNRTNEEELRYQNLLGLLAYFLNEDLASTTLDQFLANMSMADDLVSQDLIADEFGYPLRGLGIDINTNQDSPANAGVKEALTFIAADAPNLHDTNPYDIGLLDQQDEITAITYSGSLPPVGSPIPPGSTFDSFDTPLNVSAPARVFEVTFNASQAALAAMPTPRFLIWLPDQPNAIQVSVVERVSPNLFRFSIPRASLAKISVG